MRLSKIRYRSDFYIMFGRSDNNYIEFSNRLIKLIYEPYIDLWQVSSNPILYDRVMMSEYINGELYEVK